MMDQERETTQSDVAQVSNLRAEREGPAADIEGKPEGCATFDLNELQALEPPELDALCR